MNYFKTAQVQVFSQGSISIRYSSKTIDEWIEHDKEHNLINKDTKRIVLNSDLLKAFTTDDDHDKHNSMPGYTLYYLQYDDFIGNNWGFEFLGNRIEEY